MPDHEPLDTMLSYLTDSLDASERAAVRVRIDAGDPETLAALAEAEGLLAGVAETLEPVEPSAESRDRLMERVRGEDERQQSRLMAMATTRRGTGGWAVAASFLIGAGIGAGFIFAMLWSDRVIDRDQIAQLKVVVTEQQGMLDDHAERLDQAEATVDLALTAGVRSRDLAGSAGYEAARGRLLWDRTSGRLSFFAKNLMPPTDGRVYQLWFVTEDGAAVSLGTLDADARGEVRYAARLDELPEGIAFAAVSLEPRGGEPGPGPTGPIVMRGEV